MFAHRPNGANEPALVQHIDGKLLAVTIYSWCRLVRLEIDICIYNKLVRIKQ